MKKHKKSKAILFIVCLLFVSNGLVHIVFEASKKQMILKPMDYDDVFGDITVISPNSFDVLRTGEKFSIKWNAMGGIEYVTIALYRRSKFVDSIAIVTKNDGAYDWVVGQYDEGKDYSIGIWDYYDFNACDFSDYFEIVNETCFRFNPIIVLFIVIGSLGGIAFILILLRKK